MQKQKQAYSTVFLIVSSLASLFVLTEIVMNSFGKSICVTEGCKMTAQSARFGDISIYFMGLATFLLLAGLSFLSRSGRKPGIERVINLILVVALAGEGFFMGYLAFRIHTLCVFCVTIFGFMVILGTLRLLSGEKDLIAGFATLAVVFIVQYLVLPAGIPVHLPPHERLILFYSKDCKHCAEVIRELDEKKITVAHVPVNEYVMLLKNMGIENVPTLMVNDPYQKIFLTGKEAIDRYLLACTASTASGNRARQKARVRQKTAPVSSGSGAAVDIFNQPGFLSAPTPSAADNGMCKEDEICK